MSHMQKNYLVAAVLSAVCSGVIAGGPDQVTLAQLKQMHVSKDVVARFKARHAHRQQYRSQSQSSKVVKTTTDISYNRYQRFFSLGALGYFTGTANQTFSVTSLESDKLTQKSQKGHIAYSAGFSKGYKLNSRLFPAMTLGLTMRYDPAAFTGDVYQFLRAPFDNYTYRFKVDPISALMMMHWQLPQWHKIKATPYIATGLGATLAALHYKETAKAGIPASSARNISTWKIRPDVALGFGLTWQIKRAYYLSMQYLYQYRGGITRISAPGFIQGVPVDLDQQSGNVVFGWYFDRR